MLTLKCTKTIWVTQEGTRIKVTDMERSHIASVLVMLKIHAFQMKIRKICENNKSIKKILSMTDEQFLLENVPAYEALLKEAAKRRISVIGYRP